ncbi:MAG: hypothetical protein OEV42_18150 [Deltaproteobacteria bacterium]|nr:hypothetical protein [Deltaproteobacteria bacterium]
MNKSCIKFFLVIILITYVFVPAISKAQTIDLYLDVCNRYEGNAKIDTILEGTRAFIKGHPKLDINIKLFGFPLDGPNTKRVEAAVKKFKVKSVTKVDSLYDEFEWADPEESVKIVVSGGKGNWDELKEMFRERDALKLYVVGVNLPTPAIMRSLLGTASASGGQYFNAKGTKKLVTALKNVEKMSNYNLEVRVFKNRYSELTDWLMSRYEYVWTSDVYKAGKHDKPITSTYIFPARYNLESGVYDIKVNYGGKSKWIEGVKINRFGLTEKKANFAIGMVNIRVLNGGHDVKGVDRRGRDCWWSEAYFAGKHDKDVDSTRTFPPEFNLVNGNYDIKIHYRGYEQWINDVHVKQGKVHNFQISFPHAKKCTEKEGTGRPAGRNL